MFIKLLINDIAKSKFTSFTIVLFIALTTFLLSLALMLSVTLINSVNRTMQQAKTPHYLQMHSGEFDASALDAFASEHTSIVGYQLIEFVNLKDFNFIVNNMPLDGGVQDNGLVKQATNFDYLLSENGQVIMPQKSEIYVPKMYADNQAIKPLDTIQIFSKTFTVKGYVIDSQMSSPLSTSKRFLVHEDDFNELKALGKIEYLVEFRLNKLDDITLLESAYAESGLGNNGPALTYNMFRFINYISDSALILILIISGYFTLMISFLSINLTIRLNIEENIKDIGILKAIGISSSQVKGLYRTKYIGLALIGSVFGMLLTAILSGALINTIKVTLSTDSNLNLSGISLVIGAACIFVFIMLYVETTLYRVNKITFLDALYYTGENSKHKSSNFLRLAKCSFLNSNLFMAIKGYGTLKSYSSLIMVIVLCIMLMNFPVMLYSSIASEDIITSMGIGQSDLIISIKQSANMQGLKDDITASLKADDRIKSFGVLTTRMYDVILDDGSKNGLLVETGDLKKFPIKYSMGKAPNAKNEIVLATIAAEQYGKTVGDILQVDINGKVENLTVSGIYSDITNGGKTAKGIFENESKDIMWVNIPVGIKNIDALKSIITDYTQSFKGANIADVQYYISKTFGLILNSVRQLAIVAFIFGILILFFICSLYYNLLIVKEKYAVNIQRVLGFSHGDILVQYRLRTLMITIFSIVIGTFISRAFSALLLSVIVSVFGVSDFVFSTNPYISYLLVPVLVTGILFLALSLISKKIYQYSIIDSIKEA